LRKMLAYRCYRAQQAVTRRLLRRSDAWRGASTSTTDNSQDKLETELPYFRSSFPLGTPLPFDEHACSVSLPTWSSVVGYEEGDIKVTSALQCGYPRFVYHPYVVQLMQVVLDKYSPKGKEDCLILPTKQATLRCQAFLQQALEKATTVDNALIEELDATTTTAATTTTTAIETRGVDNSRIRTVSIPEINVHAVLFPAETMAGMEAKAYWQHTGELVSSRRAEQALNQLGLKVEKRVTCCPVEGTPAIHHSCEEETNIASNNNWQRQLQDRIMDWTGVPRENVFLTPTGMASIYRALRSSRRRQLQKDPNCRGGTSVVYGFPYLDTLKLCSRSEFCPDGVEFFGKGDELDLRLFERLLEQRKSSRWSALVTEIPSNPLLQCPDMEKLRELADAHDFCLVVDDTIGNFLNVDLIDSGLADAVCTSLTKLVSGRGDAMAGSVVCNPNTERGRWMQEDMAKEVDLHGGLYEADARAMVINSTDFVERNAKINETSEKLADFLHDHPDVETTWYPKYVAPLYPKVQKGGFGGLMSIHLHPHMCQRTFYDALDVAKGPSLGTNFTLICPYTLLAHYHELDFAMSYNVPPNLIRIAVGLEDFEDLKSRFANALAQSRLHPKLAMRKKSS
jgi:cystathionine gamma-synthase